MPKPLRNTTDKKGGGGEKKKKSAVEKGVGRYSKRAKSEKEKKREVRAAMLRAMPFRGLSRDRIRFISAKCLIHRLTAMAVEEFQNVQNDFGFDLVDAATLHVEYRTKRRAGKIRPVDVLRAYESVTGRRFYSDLTPETYYPKQAEISRALNSVKRAPKKRKIEEQAD